MAHILIVEGQVPLGELWKRHIERSGARADLVSDAEGAMRVLNLEPVDLLVVDLALPEGGALTVADYAGYRRPAAKVIFVTSTTFFSDGSIFQHAANACAMLPADTPPDDLVALVDHYAVGT